MDLTPGDRVALGGQLATFVAAVSSHPLWPHLNMVIWKVDGETSEAEDRWSHDALDPRQDVGDPVPGVDREQSLRQALLHRSQW